MKNPDDLQVRAKALHLLRSAGALAGSRAADWAESLIRWEEEERGRRSLERRLQAARSAASSRCATSTGTGPPPSTGPPSMP